MGAGGVDIFLKIEGGAALKRELRKLAKQFLAVMHDELQAQGNALMASANAAAPRASGTLAASSLVTSVLQEKKGRARVAVAYLDEKAAAVHEGVHWGAHIEGTRGFKFFEKSFNAMEPQMIDAIAKRLRAVIGGGS